MRSLINFLKRFGNILLFLVLELLAVYLLAAKPNYHNIKLAKALNGTTAAVNKQLDRAADYFSLKEVNRQLARENEKLKNTLQRVYRDSEIRTFSVTDTVYRQQYIYIQAEVVNNSVNKQKNFITLNRGKNSGIEEDMAVSSSRGIVGIIVEAGRNYSIAMSVLNLEFRLSARLRKNSYFGSLTWDGLDENSLVLNEIPSHVNVSVGDTIETTGFSAVFPEGIMVGTVSDVEGGGGDFYSIRVKPSTEFRKLNNVYVIVNLDKEDQLQLETEIRGTI
ncbi:MAG: rod shape-determining protein MreC [Bacteroidales bacterium]|jgi:rod shape-determining protein MreC|nr:rod shape-determining protein MreC [Bacteroidales bacterium]